MKIEFYKYQATGNDFVMLDNRNSKYESLPNSVINRLCDRRFGIGADGLILLNQLSGCDFEMKYFNANGSLGSMCGNGGRCIVAFAHDMGINRDVYSFMAYDGLHRANIKKAGWVELEMRDVNKIEKEGRSVIINTGSPHYVSFVTDVKNTDVFSRGREIRNSRAFKEEGINVNFVERKAENSLAVRTYERGVEDETYSCGTGVVASAIAIADDIGPYAIRIQTRGGSLEVSFNKENSSYKDIRLSGPAVRVFHGQINVDKS